MAALQAVRSELATLSMKESIEKNRAEDERLTIIPSGPQNQQWYRRPLGCPNSQAKGRGESCDYCHVCGSSDHWARSCRKKNSGGDNAGSGPKHGLQLRDRKKPTLTKTLGLRKAFVVSESREGSSFQAVFGLQSGSVLWREVPETSLEQSHERPKQHVAVANLVGKMCKVSCVLNGVPVEALWDTGAQVSVALKSWLGEYLPSLKPRNIAELL